MLMKRVVERTLSIGLAILIVGGLSLIAIALFGGSVLGILSVILGFPMAFPMTTALLVFVFILVILRRK